MKRIISIGMFIGVFGLPALALAHSWGVSYIEEVNGYKVDIGYSVPNPGVGESIVFDYGLFGKDGVRFTDFSDVWVRITKGPATVFATGVHNNELGGSRLSYSFLAPGDYVIHARYEKGDATVAEVMFPLTVSGKVGGAPDLSWLLYGGVGLALGYGAAVLVQKRRAG